MIFFQALFLISNCPSHTRDLYTFLQTGNEIFKKKRSFRIKIQPPGHKIEEDSIARDNVVNFIHSCNKRRGEIYFSAQKFVLCPLVSCSRYTSARSTRIIVHRTRPRGDDLRIGIIPLHVAYNR